MCLSFPISRQTGGLSAKEEQSLTSKYPTLQLIFSISYWGTFLHPNKNKLLCHNNTKLSCPTDTWFNEFTSNDNTWCEVSHKEHNIYTTSHRLFTSWSVMALKLWKQDKDTNEGDGRRHVLASNRHLVMFRTLYSHVTSYSWLAGTLSFIQLRMFWNKVMENECAL